MGGFFSNLFFERRRLNQQRVSLERAFAGEVSAILNIAEKRQYKEGIEKHIAYIENTGEPIRLTIDVSHEYMRVYENNVDKIGLLTGDLPAKISRFYTYAMSILEDITSLKSGWLATADAEDLLANYKEMLEIMIELRAIGDEIVSRVAE